MSLYGWKFLWIKTQVKKWRNEYCIKRVYLFFLNTTGACTKIYQ